MLPEQKPNALLNALSAALRKRQDEGRFISMPSLTACADAVDFGSNDTLSISAGVLRDEFLRELHRNPGFSLGSKGSRVFGGTSHYLDELESYIAIFHNAKDALFFNSGFDANVAIFGSLPQPDDCIVYDELIHASAHDGMRRSRASAKVMFRHNDTVSFRETLCSVKQAHPAIANGTSTAFIALESIYSMDGDMCPVKQIVAVAQEVLPSGNHALVMDEAHSNGLVGHKGSGIVCHYNLEDEFPIRLHTFGKALGASGAVVLCDPVIKSALINYARNLIFTTAPCFPVLAAVKAGYTILDSEDGDQRRQRVQQMTAYFYSTVDNHRTWQAIQGKSKLRLVGAEGWQQGSFLSPIVALVTGPGLCHKLAAQLLDAGFLVHAVTYPVVPPDKERIRITIHADNTEKEIEQLVEVILQFACAQSINCSDS